MKQKRVHHATELPPGDLMDGLLARLKLRHLELVEMLAGTGSLRAAARQLGLAQPAAGVLLREVEHAFGQALFERSATGVVPTRAALVLLARIRVVLANMRMAVQETAESGVPELRLGMVPTSLMTHGARLIHALRQQVSPLRVQVETHGMRALMQRVLDARLDAAVARFPSPQVALELQGRCEIVQMAVDTWCVVARKGLMRERQRSRVVPLARLAGMDWVLPSADTQLYTTLQETCLRAGVPAPPPVVVVDGIHTSMVVASEGDLLTICSESMLDHPLAHNLEKVDVGLSFYPAPMALFYPRESAAMPALRVLRDLVATA